MANTYCVNCGEAVEGAFCSACGAPVTAGAGGSSKPTFSAPTNGNSGKTLQTGRLSYRAAIKSFFANYVNFEGRASLSAFWYATLFFTFVSIVATNLDHGSHGLFAVVDSGPITNLVTLAFLLPNLSVAIRRLHDIGRSGHSLWFALIPFVGAILLIVWLATKSEPADNRFGPRA